MGYKASLIIIENPLNISDDQVILNAIGCGNYKFEEETSLELCIYPNDNSINIGYYNGNIIIADDYQITSNYINPVQKLKLIKEEEKLVSLFPNSEILSVVCHSGNNLHAYSLIKNGKKLRLKTISTDDKLQEIGERFFEEDEIYKNSFKENGDNFWKEGDELYSEDCLMEEFTFGISKRLLKVRIDNYEESKELDKVVFRKYLSSKTSQLKNNVLKNKYFHAVLIIAFYFLFKIILKKFFS